MGTFIQIISGIYLAFIALGGFVAIRGGVGESVYGAAGRTYTVIALVALALPAIALYAFGQLVNDTRQTRNTLAEMLKLLRDGR